MKKKRCIAMLLAGGQGTRLYALTKLVAKPAVSFGGKYRIIDFTLSNITNSGLDTVGVLTQYQPLVLNEYLDNGSHWDLDRGTGGLHVLPPYMAKSGGEWYKGTANAIFQNLHFLARYDSEHVLILSGDHIYKMDYSLMLKEHIDKDADCTIAVIDVPLSQAHRFGIMDYDDNKTITCFEEKPAMPRCTHASMGIYIFKKEALVEELIRDGGEAGSDHDFGKNIIPSMLKRQRKLLAYTFEGYWKDVGTVSSLWEANMDLLGPHPKIDLADGFTVYSHNEALPPCYIGEGGRLNNSLATAGCEIYGEVYNSVISENVKIGRGSVIRNSIVMRNAVIGENCFLDYVICDERVEVCDDCTLGGKNSDREHIILLGREACIEAGSKIEAGKIIEKEGGERP